VYKLFLSSELGEQVLVKLVPIQHTVDLVDLATDFNQHLRVSIRKIVVIKPEHVPVM